MSDDEDIIDAEIVEDPPRDAGPFRTAAPGAIPNADYPPPPPPRVPQLGDVWKNENGIMLRVLGAANEVGLHRVLDMRTSATLFADLTKCELVEASPLDGPELEPDSYEIEIVSVSWSQDHTQAYIEFDAHGAPNMSFSTVRVPRLTATVSMRADPNRQLGAGEYTGGTALAAHGAPKGYGGDLGIIPEPEGAPEMPSDEAIAAACRTVLRRHVEKALDENRRAGMRKATQESLIGRKLTLKI